MAANGTAAGEHPRRSPSVRVNPRWALLLAFFFNGLSVALVLPTLPSKYRDLGLRGWKFGVMGSVYSLCQLIGGLALGAASDRILGRRGLLLVSFAGAAVSYSLVAIARSLPTLVLSRVIVGLTQQSLTAVSAMVSDLTAAEGPAARTTWFSRISCVSTLSWVVGSALGGFLAEVSPQLPDLVAVGLYGVNACWTVSTVPPFPTKAGPRSSFERSASTKASPVVTACMNALHNIRHVLGRWDVSMVLVAQLSRSLVGRALGSMSEMYELERWSLHATDVGLLKSFKSGVGFLVQMLVIPFLTERYDLLHLLHAFTWCKIAVDFVELVPSHVLQVLLPDGMLRHLPHKLAEDPSLAAFVFVCTPVRGHA